MINHKRGLNLSKLFHLSVMVSLAQFLFIENYQELHRYSVEDYGFWEDLWDYIGVVYSVPPEKVRMRRCFQIFRNGSL